MDTAENWYALSLSIVGGITPEQAMKWIEEGEMTQKIREKMQQSIKKIDNYKHRKALKPASSKEQVEENKRKRREETKQMAEMRRSGMTYLQIGEIFSLHKTYVSVRIRKYEEEINQQRESA